MPAAYSKDLCEKVVIKYFGLHQTMEQVAQDLVVSNGFCYSVMERWHNLQGLSIPPHPSVLIAGTCHAGLPSGLR